MKSVLNLDYYALSSRLQNYQDYIDEISLLSKIAKWEKETKFTMGFKNSIEFYIYNNELDNHKDIPLSFPEFILDFNEIRKIEIVGADVELPSNIDKLINL